MKKILVIDNFDSFTFNLVDAFRRMGPEVVVYRNDIEVSKVKHIAPDAIVFSPGPSTPKEAGNMVKIIETFAERIPLLGICLGHEAFIEVFGGALQFIEPVHGEASKIHHDEKTIFHNVTQDFFGGRYHSLAGKEIPNCFEVSAKCGPLIMAIRHKTLPIEGVQFHPESVLTMRGNNGFKILNNFYNHYVNQ